MNKLCLMLAFLFLTGGVYAATEESGSQTVTMNIADAIALTVPADLNWGDLSIGDNESPPRTVTVKSTASYDLKLKNYNGAGVPDSVKLMPWKYCIAGDSFYVAGGYITDTLQVKGGDISSYTDISTDYIICLDNAPPTSDDGTDTNIYYRINVGYSDRRLTGITEAYAIKITFLATQSI